MFNESVLSVKIWITEDEWLQHGMLCRFENFNDDLTGDVKSTRIVNKDCRLLPELLPENSGGLADYALANFQAARFTRRIECFAQSERFGKLWHSGFWLCEADRRSKALFVCVDVIHERFDVVPVGETGLLLAHLETIGDFAAFSAAL